VSTQLPTVNSASVGRCAHTLEALALDMRQSGSVGGRGLVWDEEMDRVEYERVQGLAGRVREMRERLA